MADQADQVSQLLAVLDSEAQKVHTQSLDLSFNELLDMYKNSELDISPEYQRLFQWSEGAQSRFIESLLLEMPVPPIYVVESAEGRYLLIDGLQRISSYLHLRGELNASHLKPPVTPGMKLELSECDIVEKLNGMTFDKLGTALQIRLKRAFVRVEVVRKGSDPRFKYHMFKRLNTGGEKLTAQQMRNCTIRLLDPHFNDFIIDLSKHNQSFRDTTTALTEEQSLGAFDQELILRFFAMKNYRLRFKHDIEDFLTEYMEQVSDQTKNMDFNYNEERAGFEKTFRVLALALGEEAFAFATKDLSKLARSFSVLHYEAFTLGLQERLNDIKPEEPLHIKEIRETFRSLKMDSAFAALTKGGGKNSSGQLANRIEAVAASIRKLSL